MVEGLARMMMGELSGEHPRDGTFEYYVAAYEALAEAANVDLQQLWRVLWMSPAGQVRAVFSAVMAEMYQHAGKALDATQQMRLRGVADSIFQTARAGWVPDAVELARVWRLALP